MSDDFKRGIGWAIAEVVRNYGGSSLAVEIMQASGYSYGDFKEVCDEEDLSILWEVWKKGRS